MSVCLHDESVNTYCILTILIIGPGADIDLSFLFFFAYIGRYDISFDLANIIYLLLHLYVCYSSRICTACFRIALLCVRTAYIVSTALICIIMVIYRKTCLRHPGSHK